MSEPRQATRLIDAREVVRQRRMPAPLREWLEGEIERAETWVSWLQVDELEPALLLEEEHALLLLREEGDEHEIARASVRTVALVNRLAEVVANRAAGEQSRAPSCEEAFRPVR